jgi:ferredoxin
MKLYSRRTLDRSRAIFNYRLSCACVVEYAFGIYASKWRIVGKAIETKVGRCGNCEVRSFTAQYYHRRRGFG